MIPKQETDLGPLLVLVGPTAIGKTALSLSLAHALKGEIISGDAFQVYRGMNIGTAKIHPDDMEGIPHHLIDICNPDQAYTAADFQAQAGRTIKDIQARGFLPMVVGGTGLYINGLIYHYQFGNRKPDAGMRKKLDILYDQEGGEALLARLRELDPRTAKGLYPNDRHRILRALEVVVSSGQPISHQGQDMAAYQSAYRLCLIGLTMNREDLYHRINQRVEHMFSQGLVAEVQALLAKGYSPDALAFKGIGYKEVIPYVQGKSSLQEAKALIQRNSRRLAKRQWTWFRRDPHIQWFSTDKRSHDDILKDILEAARKALI